MIATHNVKVNGRWYSAGEEIPEEKPVKAETKAEEPKAEQPVAEQETLFSVQDEEPKETPKPKTSASRRKTSR